MGIYVAKNSEQLGPFDIEALAKAVFGQEKLGGASLGDRLNEGFGNIVKSVKSLLGS